MKILKLILENENTIDIDYNLISKKTEGFSGSDLHELCRLASLYGVREYAKKVQDSTE